MISSLAYLVRPFSLPDAGKKPCTPDVGFTVPHSYARLNQSPITRALALAGTLLPRR